VNMSRNVSAAGGKGYGDLGGGGAEDKENFGVDGREGDGDYSYDESLSMQATPDIVISEPTFGGLDMNNVDPEPVDIGLTPMTERTEEFEGGDEEEDRFSDLGDETEDARSLRRSSHGTTVITTPADGEEDWSEREGDHGRHGEEDDGIDDAASDWTESVVDRESEMEAGVPVAAAS
jgi:hypothetical protein